MVGVVVEAVVVVEAGAGVTERWRQTEAAELQIFHGLFKCVHYVRCRVGLLAESPAVCVVARHSEGQWPTNNSRSRRRYHQASSLKPIPAARAATSPL